MDPFQLKLIIISFILALLISIFIYHSKKLPNHNAKIRPAPQAGGGWPIIGHMHLFRGNQLPHKTLAAMTDKYGPIFTIRLGSSKGLVLSSWEMAKECFTVHDKAFSDRPATAASKLLGYNHAMFGFAPYSPYWREMRKIATIEFFSSQRIDQLKDIRASELETGVREIYNSWSRQNCPKDGILVDMKQWFGDLAQNMALRLVVGKSYFGASDDSAEGDSRRHEKVIRDFMHLSGVFVISDVFPFLGKLDIDGYQKTMKKTADELDSLVEGWLEEHKQKRSFSKDAQKDQDFMDVMLSILQDAQIRAFDSDTIIKATCLNLFLGGTDTIQVTLTWALSLLLNNQKALKKAQDELETHIGKNRRVEESDLKKLMYLQAVVKETMRLYPAAPLNALRSSMADCIFSARYHIPAGTRLLLNTWKIHRDERVWPDPHEFLPERFLTSHKDIDVRGQNFELIPFGSGRRSCPGASLALQVVHLTLARLLQSFHIAMPSNEVVDMTESIGLTNLKATPLEVLLTPRFNDKAYGN